MEMRSGAAQRAARGFTLVELLVTITIVGILASIAVPAYQSQIRKSRRTDARTALLDLAAKEERFLAVQNVYTNAAASLGYAGFPQLVNSGYYQIAAPVVGAGTLTAAPTFSITATPVAGAGQDRDAACASFTVDSTGKQSSTDSGNVDSTATCWK